MFDSRLLHLLRKEFIQLFRDKRLLAIAIVPPILQMLVFGYVATTDVKNVPTAICDQNNSVQSRDFISKMTSSGYFIIAGYPENDKQLACMLDNGTAMITVKIPPDFSEKILSYRQAPLQIIVDGTDSNTASIAMGYINNIVYEYSLELMSKKGRTREVIDARVRVFHNQEQKSVNYMIPGIIGMLLMLITTILTSVSIVKEKESGTLEQLLVSPIKPYELMLSKLIPYALIGFVDVLLVVAVGSSWFHVPILGSFWLLLLLSGFFLLTSLGLGLLISTISANMQQTILTVMFIFMPFILLSGFIFPISNMPEIIQWVTLVIPLRYFLEIVRGIFLKGSGIDYLWPQAMALLLIGMCIFVVAVGRFRKKIS